VTKDLFDGYCNLKFDEARVKFGGHETFALRFGWLSKGFQALVVNQEIFGENYSDHAPMDLGVGKNMVKSIEYWLRATQVISQKGHQSTEIGFLIFDRVKGLDPYLEDEATIWLMHWLLSSNASFATAYFWFFNYFHKSEFTSQELTTALNDFVNDKVDASKRAAITTLTKDARLIHRMYTPSKGNTATPLEDALDSPLASLRLMSQTTGGRSFQSKPETRPSLPVAVIGFALSSLFVQRQDRIIPIEDLMKSRNGYAALGSIFRLTENELITKLELLVDYIPDKFEIRDTAGINQIYQIDSIEPVDYLLKYYQDSQVGEAA
jgi:hypothetical protein